MRVFGLDVLTVGNANPHKDSGFRVLQAGGAAQGYYRRLLLRDDVLVGAVMINRVEQGGILRALIENRMPIRMPPEALIAPGFNFGRLFH
jgi:NAD(P)H-nitrite reductase large subunit